jgi:hypothetical protein
LNKYIITQKKKTRDGKENDIKENRSKAQKMQQKHRRRVK